MKLNDYYKYYLSLHQNKWNRRLHVLGQLTTLLFAYATIVNWHWYLFPLIPFVVYPFAWSGHYFFEKNKPAAFSSPIMAKISDILMFRDWILGRIAR